MSRSFGACEGKEVVGTAAAWPCDMVVPGGAASRCGRGDRVGVLPTQVRGILTDLMRSQLEDVADQGQPVAILYTSESIIYGRFGYGIATSGASLTLETKHSRFLEPFVDPGRIRLVTRSDALQMFPSVFEEFDRDPAGSISRPPRDGHTRSCTARCPRVSRRPEFYVVHEDGKGKLDGAMAYEILDRDSWWGKPGYIELHDLFGSPAAYVSLWRHGLDLDLAEGVKFHMRRPDEALRWMLADPRRLEMKLEDQLWLGWSTCRAPWRPARTAEPASSWWTSLTPSSVEGADSRSILRNRVRPPASRADGQPISR